MTPEPSNEYQKLVEAVAGAVLAEWNDERPCHDKCANETAKHCACAKDTAEAALSALKPPAGDDGWRDIATAPKDGTRILVIGTSVGWQGYPFVVEWDAGLDWWRHTDPSLHALYAVSDSIDHWRPLPTPPAKGTPHV